MNYFIRMVIILVSTFVLISCGDESKQQSKKSIFRYNQPNTITSLDPAFARSQNNIWAVHHLFNTLVQLDEGLNIQPCLAKKWSISEDGMTYEFILRDDVFFHDDPQFEGGKGRKMVAVDIQYSFERLLDPGVNSPGSWVFKDKIADEQPFRAINDTTFQLVLSKPFRPMLGILTMQYCSVIPKEVAEYYGKDFRVHPVGTGPFRFVNIVENQSLILEKNPAYFERYQNKQLPLLDGVLVKFLNDRKTAYLELKQGNLDYMSGLESSYVNDLLSSSGELKTDFQDQLKFIKAPYLNMEYLGVNLEFGKDEANPLLKKEVRQALNYGFDRKKMLQTLRNNVGQAANAGFIPRGLPSHNPQIVKGYTYQPERARQLLKEAGYPGGEGMPTITLSTNKDYLDLCTFITRQWEDLGVKVEIEVVESATLRQRMANGQAAFFRGSWIADYPDGESFLTVFYGENPSPPNYTRFKNVAFDALYEKALKENDDARRMTLYHEMDKLLVEEAPVIFLFYDETAVFVNNKISGINENALNLLDLKQVVKESRKVGKWENRKVGK